MKALLIQYTVLYSKAGYSVAAMYCSQAATDGLRLDDLLHIIRDELAYAGAPTWLYNSLKYHAGQLVRKSTASLI